MGLAAPPTERGVESRETSEPAVMSDSTVTGRVLGWFRAISWSALGGLRLPFVAGVGGLAGCTSVEPAVAEKVLAGKPSKHKPALGYRDPGDSTPTSPERALLGGSRYLQPYEFDLEVHGTSNRVN